MQNGHKRRVAGAANAWLEAATRQAHRVLEGSLRDDQNVEFMLFASALNNAARGAKSILGEGHPRVRDFASAARDSKAIRDMLEHFDDYLAGTGKLQTKPTSDGVHAPWMMVESGADSLLPGGSEYSVAVFTKTGSSGEQTAFTLDVRSSLRACADLIEDAIREAGIDQVSDAVLRARSV